LRGRARLIEYKHLALVRWLNGCQEVKHVGSLDRLWAEEEGQDIAEYAVMLAVILVIVVGTLRLIGGNANNVFSSVASSIGQ
jgi:Flp pilus assembly pilin Flp